MFLKRLQNQCRNGDQKLCCLVQATGRLWHLFGLIWPMSTNQCFLMPRWCGDKFFKIMDWSSRGPPEHIDVRGLLVWSPPARAIIEETETREQSRVSFLPRPGLVAQRIWPKRAPQYRDEPFIWVFDKNCAFVIVPHCWETYFAPKCLRQYIHEHFSFQ